MAAQPERNYTAAAADIHRRRSFSSQSNGAELIIYNRVFACNSQMKFRKKEKKKTGGKDADNFQLRLS